ncbi:MAG: YncE family protein [Gemmatimonadota bacterium]
MNRVSATVALMLSALLPGAAPAQAGPHYTVSKRVVLGGDTGWDYLLADTVTHRIYVSHGSHVVVLDLDNLSVVGDIPNTNGVHGIVAVPSVGRGFTSNGRDTSVTIFDLKTLATIGTVKVTGANPDAIMFDPVSGRVFTFNGRGANATAIDPASGSVVGTVTLNGKPEEAIADGTGMIYVNLEDSSSIAVFDTQELKVLHTWSLSPCEEPSGLAFDAVHNRLFAACGNGLMAVLNPATGKVVATLHIGDGVDGAGFDPKRQLAFSSNGDGTLTMIREVSPDSFAVVGNIPTQAGARTMSLDAVTGRIFLTSAQFGAAPAATTEQPRPRRPMVPGTFTLLVVSPNAD